MPPAKSQEAVISACTKNLGGRGSGNAMAWNVGFEKKQQHPKGWGKVVLSVLLAKKQAPENKGVIFFPPKKKPPSKIFNPAQLDFDPPIWGR